MNTAQRLLLYQIFKEECGDKEEKINCSVQAQKPHETPSLDDAEFNEDLALVFPEDEINEYRRKYRFKN